MNDFTFTPVHDDLSVKVPCLEDARADFAPYYTSAGHGVTIAEAQQAVVVELGKLGAGVLGFQRGFYGTGKAKRHGYVIRFAYAGAQGEISVAGLPIRAGETDRKKEQALVQALLNVRDWLKASVTARVFNPQSDPLVQYLLVDGQKTLVQAMYESGRLPQLEAGDVVTGEIVEG